jgi:hypothetical protein
MPFQKAFELNNFNAVVAIITGLQSEWVARAMRRSWGRVGIWETRMLNSLKAFAANADDFRHVRKAIDRIADAKPLDVNAHASVVSGADGQLGKGKAAESKPLACVPFMG